MGSKGKDQDILPYRGEVTWLSRSKKWTVTVRGWDSRPDLRVSAADVFDGPTLTIHLSSANMNPDFIMPGEVECVFGLQARGWSIDDKANALLRILRRHYNHHKGRPIVWSRVKDQDA